MWQKQSVQDQDTNSQDQDETYTVNNIASGDDTVSWESKHYPYANHKL